MNLLNIALFWHMHQPYYRDPLRGEYTLPWVRLHACKGYYDMISLLEEYPAIRQTFNLVPSLLRQLNEYARGEARDIFLEHTRKPAEELSPEEKKIYPDKLFHVQPGNDDQTLSGLLGPFTKTRAESSGIPRG